MPAHWRPQGAGIGDPAVTRCQPARVELITPPAAPDGTTTDGERCMQRTVRRTLGSIQIVCTEGWERDGFGDPASVCGPVVASAR